MKMKSFGSTIIVFIVIALFHIGNASKYKYIISGHGGRWSTDSRDFVWNWRYPVYYFVGDGEALYNDPAHNIFDDLESQGRTDTKPTETIEKYKGRFIRKKRKETDPKRNTHNYQIWSPYGESNIDDWKDQNGVLRVGIYRITMTKEKGGKIQSIVRINDLRSATEDNPYTLGAFINDRRYRQMPGPIYWLACRSVGEKVDAHHQYFDDILDYYDYKLDYGGSTRTDFMDTDNFSSEKKGADLFAVIGAGIMVAVIIAICGFGVLICGGLMGYMIAKNKNNQLSA